MTEWKWVPGGRLPEKAALGLAILWTVCTLGFGFLAFDGGVTGWQRAFQVVATAAGLVAAACYWFRYARAKRNRA